MGPTERCRRLIVNADDFGWSPAINEAVIRAHREGILTSASLMVTGPAAAAAIELARANPGLGVGLHLTLAGGRACAPPAEIPGLCDADGMFRRQAVRAGIAYFFRPELKSELRREIAAQFRAFAESGLPGDHVNGHFNLHLHPTIAGMVTTHCDKYGIRGFRLTRDRFWLGARLAGGAWLYRITHAIVFHLLCAWLRPRVHRAGLTCTGHVFGLLQNGRMDEDFLLALLPRLPRGDSELYAHPSLTNFRHEFVALTSPRVHAAIASEGIRLVRYQDLMDSPWARAGT
jgi:hopanoid biosynthesis associated protein HpnK